MSCRFKKIQDALKGMDAKIEAHREVRSVSIYSSIYYIVDAPVVYEPRSLSCAEF